jgi:hypothetical protein
MAFRCLLNPQFVRSGMSFIDELCPMQVRGIVDRHAPIAVRCAAVRTPGTEEHFVEIVEVLETCTQQATEKKKTTGNRMNIEGLIADNAAAAGHALV